MLINVHSHQPAVKNEWVLQSRYRHFNIPEPVGYYSMGLHPWYITTETFDKELEQLKQSSKNHHVLAIGECGLDKVCATDFALQQKAFAAQIEWANHIKKPLIIHCVRAYAEVQQLLQQQHNTVPVVFNCFNKYEKFAKQLIDKCYYLSFGKVLQQPAMQQVIQKLPADKIFLETDDATVEIETIYAWAAQALQIDILSLSLQIKKNAATVFGAGWF